MDYGEEKKMFTDDDAIEVHPGSPTDDANNKSRGQWGNSIQAFCVILGAVIGLGNLWRFPYMVYNNGGGAFLIPYCIFAVFLGFPLMFLEVSLGQYTRKGSINAWKLSPLCKGIGFGSAMLALYSSLYYITVMAWAINYMYSCFTINTTLPWMHCTNWFNTEKCITYEVAAEMASNSSSSTNLFDTNSNYTLSVVEYWDHYNLRISDGFHEMGGLENAPLAISLLVAWAIVYFTIFKGTESSGLMSYFTAIFPYIVISILLVKGLTMDGAGNGIMFYLKPNVTKLAEPKVWMDAGSQVCFSYVICFAVLITVSSYNDFHKDTFKHAAKISIACSVTSFFAGFAVFAVLGNMAHVMNVEVANVVSSGPGLTFQAYPTALSLMPFPQFWNFLFFLMIVSLGISCEWTTVEALLTVFFDHMPRFRKYREWVSLALCITLYLVGLVFTTPGGVYVFELFNSYAVGGVPLMWLTTFEALAIGWVYGYDKFADNAKTMIGYTPPRFIEFCIKFISPALTLSVFVFSCITIKPLTIQGYEYPSWANAIGYVLAFSSVICIPNYALYQITLHDGSLSERFKKSCESTLYRHTTKSAFIKAQTASYQDNRDEEFVPLETYEESEMTHKKSNGGGV